MKTVNHIILIAILLIANILSSVGQGVTEIQVQSGQDQIQALAFSSDNRFIVSGSKDFSLKLWSLSTNKEIRTFSGHTDRIFDVAFSPDGKFIASGSGDNTVKLWDALTGKEIRTFTGHTDRIKSVVFSPDSKTVLSGSDDKTAILWDIASGQKKHEFKGHTGRLGSIAFSKDGKYVATGGYDKTIKIWNITDQMVLKTIQEKNPVVTLSFSPDGKYIVDGTYSTSVANVNLWSTESGMLIKELSNKEECGRIFATVFSPDSKNIYSANYGNNPYSTSMDVSKWSVQSLNENPKSNDIPIYCSAFAFSTNCQTIVMTGQSKSIQVWDVPTNKKIAEFSGFSGGGGPVAISSDGQKIISGGLDQSIKIWDISSCKTNSVYSDNPLKALNIPAFYGGSLIHTVALSADGNIGCSGSADKTIQVWDMQGKKDPIVLIGHSRDVNSVALSPNGKYVVSGSDDNTIKLWDISTGKEIRSITANSLVGSVTFSPDGKTICSNGLDFIAKIWKVEDGSLISLINSVFGPVAFSPDGKFLFCGDSYYNVQLIDIASKKALYHSKGHTNILSAVAISSDQKFGLSGAKDGTVRLWNLADGKEIKTFLGHSGPISSVAFLPNGKQIITGAEDGSIRIWNIENDESNVFINHINKKDWIVFTSDGYWDASTNGGELVAMVNGLECWNIDQFAVRNNRPDIILERLGSSNKELIAHYNNQYKKRIKRLGLAEDQLTNDFNIPTAKIISNIQSGKISDVKFSLSDEKYKLKRFNIYVNDVPVYGSYGKPINDKKVELTEKVELISGDNKIEISCLNEKGAESYRALTYSNYTPRTKGDLYVIAFGVSKYENPSYNLKYADKDAMDLEKTIQNLKGKGFENVYTKVLTNEQVTPEAIKAAKDFVKNAKPDDTFILFIAGHGMHDNDPEATYYYLTSNADINNLKATAADFETIEDLLQGIPPRNKLFLMDACESGEIDEEDQGQMLAVATGSGMASRGFKTTGVIASEAGTSTSSVATKRSYLYQKDRYIYNDLVRRSGAIVFSSSKGGELSYERSDIENGLFTEYIMKALTTTEADKDVNGVVSTDELRTYVSEQVAKASGDLQHPTVDRDNIYQKFGFGVR